MQYNWGVPAALKNALDYLFKVTPTSCAACAATLHLLPCSACLCMMQEWNGKPGAIVSYG